MDEKEEQQMMAIRGMQQMTAHITETCLKKCCSDSKMHDLTQAEGTCIAYCTARLLESRYFVAKRMVDMAKKINGDKAGNGDLNDVE